MRQRSNRDIPGRANGPSQRRAEDWQHLFTFVSEIGSQIDTVNDPQALIDRAVVLLERGFDCSSVRIETAGAEVDGDTRDASGWFAPSSALSNPLAAYLAGPNRHPSPVCDDQSDSSCLSAETPKEPANGVLRMQLQLGPREVGELQLARDGASFAEEERLALKIIAEQLSMALCRIRLARDAEHQLAAMRVLHDVSVEIASQLQLGKVMKTLLKELCGLLHCRSALLLMSGGSLSRWTVAATHRNPPGWLHWQMPIVEQRSLRKFFTSRTPLIINDLGQWSDEHGLTSAYPKPRSKWANDTLMIAPLWSEDRIIGLLIVSDWKRRRRFNGYDAGLISLFGDIAAAALENAQLFSDLQRLRESLEQRVAERTAELEAANQATAAKAQRLQSLLRRTVRIQEEERSRIAGDLHDQSNQLTTAALYEVQAAQEQLRSGRPDLSLQQLEAAKETIRRLDAENRRIIAGLKPVVLEVHGLAAALVSESKAYTQSRGLDCSILITGTPVRLPPDTELGIFRIVQESLNNVVKHARATCAQVVLDFGCDSVRVTVQDDGVGFDADAATRDNSGHVGLVGIRDRAESLGGHVAVSSIPGAGTRVVLELAFR